jgi:hypothetical protein
LQTRTQPTERQNCKAIKFYRGSPASDFIFLVFTGTDQEFGKSHLDPKDSYYYAFDKFLEYFGMQTEDFYPKKRFEDEHQDHLNFGLACDLIMIPVIFSQ